MIMKRFIPSILGIIALSISLLSAKDERPNIILIISDDHTFSHYGFMGHKILYSRGYSMPVCSPSLATLLTGTLPRTNGITGNDLNSKAPQMAEKSKTHDPLRDRLLKNPLILPKALTDAGYLTFQTGKLWNAAYKDMGFTHGMTAQADRHGGAGLTIGREGMQPVFDFIEMATKEQKAFFIWYAPFLPHDPHNPPEEILTKYLGKGPTKHAEVYYAMVEWLDNTIGELDEFLVKKNLKENTIILYLSDNGWDPNAGYGGGRANVRALARKGKTPPR
jgi:arylsulfatase A-like enzyme